MGQMGPFPGTNRAPSLGQTGRFLLKSTVKSLFCPVCPWNGWGSSLGRLSRKGRQKSVYVFCVYWFFFPPKLSAAVHDFLCGRLSGCRKRRSAEGVRSFLRFSGLFCHLLVTFPDASVTFFISFLSDSFRRTPFAGLLLRQGEIFGRKGGRDLIAAFKNVKLN